jgi:hypothetical protein
LSSIINKQPCHKTVGLTYKENILKGRDKSRPVVDGKVECKSCGDWKVLEDTEILKSAINYINFHKEGL